MYLNLQPSSNCESSSTSSLVIGQVPDRLNKIMSLLFIASSILTVLVDKQSQVRFFEASSLDAFEWGGAIKCRVEQDAFKMLLHCVWLPTNLNPVCPRDHRWSSRVGRPSRPTPSSSSQSPLNSTKDGSTRTVRAVSGYAMVRLRRFANEILNVSVQYGPL